MNVNNNDKNTIVNFIKKEYNIDISDIEDLINLNLLYSKNDVIDYFINCHYFGFSSCLVLFFYYL